MDEELKAGGDMTFDEVYQEIERMAKQPLNMLAMEIHKNAVEKGWWNPEPSFGEIVCMCHSEISEAVEEYRNEKPMVNGICGKCEYDDVCGREDGGVRCKPEGIAVEMIDCMIRILDWCAAKGVDVDDILRKKMEYNAGRSYRHGGKLL